MADEFIPKLVPFCPYCLALASAPKELPPCACPKDYLDAKPFRLVSVRIGGTKQISKNLMENLHSITIDVEIDTNKATHTKKFELESDETTEQLFERVREWMEDHEPQR